MRILIAEDHADSRLVLQKTLESAGHQVTAAIHGQDALEKALAEPPELIVSDIMMPVMDGFKLCYAVKNDAQLRHIPFIFYTATYVDLEDERLGLEMGASRYIIKPIEPTEFLKIIDGFMAELQQGTVEIPLEPATPCRELFDRYDARQSKKLAKKVSQLNQYSYFFENSSDLFCILSPAGDILEVNSAFCGCFGASEENLLNRSATAYFGEDCCQEMLANARDNKPYSREIETGSAADTPLCLDISALPFRGANGKLLTVLVQARDITERKRAEKELKKAQEMINRSPAVAFQWKNEPGWPVEFVSENIEQLLGYPAQELREGKAPYLESIHPDDLARVSQEVASNSTDPKQTSFSHLPYRMKRKDGQIIWVDDSTHIRRDSTGVITHYEGIIYDVTQRIEADERERRALRKWERTFNASRDIITIQDLHCKITQCNQAAAEAFGLSKTEIVGQNCYELFSGIDVICEGCPIPLAVKSFEPYAEEIYHQKLDKTFAVNIAPILNDQGQVTSIAHFAKDISEQKKLEEQLRQIQKMESLGTLAGGIAHDFNNILSAILGYAQLAKMHSQEGSKIALDLEQILIGGQRASELVKQILTFSRKTKPETTSVKLPKVVDEAVKLLRASIPTTIEIKQDIDPDCPPILADAGQMHQIIMNLCTNGYHAMREQKNGILEISLHAKEFVPGETAPHLNILPGNYLQLMISDNGSGMDKATREKIFEPYYTTKKQGEGTGLGLAVVHGIVKNFGGQISVYSEPGQGSSFNIYLPVNEAAAEQSDEVTSPEDVPMGTERLLVVDDEPPITNLFMTMLERYGYQVTTCNQSSIALRTFRQNPDLFDLVITDYAMPEMNGIDLAEEILKIRAKTPILLCTGFSDRSSHNKALRTGIKGCLNKPIQAEELAGAVRRALDKAQN